MDGFPLELFAEFPTCRPGSLPALLRTRSTRSARQRRAHFAVPLEFFHPRIKLVDAHPKFLRDLRRRPVGGLGETDRFPLQFFAEFGVWRLGNLRARERNGPVGFSAWRGTHFVAPPQLPFPRIEFVNAHPKFPSDLCRRPARGFGQMDGFPLELFAEFPTCRPGSLPALLRTRSTRSSRQRRAHFSVPLEFFHPRI